MDDQTLHHFMQDLLPMIMLPVMTIAFAWIISLIIAAFRHRASLRAQSDFHNRLVDKFSSAEEFTNYLKSEAGRDFFEKLSSEPVTPISKILGSIQKGTILTLLGIGLFILGKVFAEPQLGRYFAEPQGGNILIIFGTISFMIGIGFLISSAISYRLAKSWGIISVDKNQISNQPSANQV